MNVLHTAKQLLSKTSVLGFIVASVLGLGVFQVLTASAADISLSGPTDCDSNAVMHCGAMSTSALQSKYTSGDGTNSAVSIQHIYKNFGISAGDISAMSTTAVAGRVTKNGDVFTNDSSAAVATGAVTAGRDNISGSTTVNQDGTTFYRRAPSVSFQSDALPAFIVMKDGVFQYAIIASCGNPVNATPKTPPPAPKPDYTIYKDVTTRGRAAFAQNITVNTGTRVTYRVTVKSTGDAAVTNLVVNDKLPANVSYIAGTLTRDGAAADAGQFFAGGITVASLAPGASTVFQFDATVGNTDTNATCKSETLDNFGHMVATNLPPKDSEATVNKQCLPPPTCDLLDITSEANRTVRISQMKYTLNHASFVKAVVSWGDNATTGDITDASKIVGQTHQYGADGTYTVGVTLTFTQNGDTLTITGPQCQKQVTYSPTGTTTSTKPVITTPTTLVNTGAGSTIGLFAAISLAAAGAHRWFLARRFSGSEN